VAYIIIWHYQYFLVVIMYIVCLYSILSIIVIAIFPLWVLNWSIKYSYMEPRSTRFWCESYVWPYIDNVLRAEADPGFQVRGVHEIVVCLYSILSIIVIAIFPLWVLNWSIKYPSSSSSTYTNYKY
jgi:hypothetical protein